MPAFANVLYEVADALALITINRPDKLNAISLATLDDLRGGRSGGRKRSCGARHRDYRRG